eukprot:2977596-Amphidinium_carterae.1
MEKQFPGVIILKHLLVLTLLQWPLETRDGVYLCVRTFSRQTTVYSTHLCPLEGPTQGDDGQADLQVADDMLSLRCADWDHLLARASEVPDAGAPSSMGRRESQEPNTM